MDLPSLPKVPTFPAMSSLPDVTIPSIDTGAFTSGPLEEVATADFYKLTGGAKITSIQELNLNLDSNSMFDFSLAPGGAKDFLTKIESGALPFNNDLLMGRIQGVADENKGLMSGLTDAMKKGAALATFKDKGAGFLVNIGGQFSSVNPANMKDVRALGGFINKYTGTKIFSGKDSGAMSGLLSTVIGKASDLGVGGAFKAITDTVNDTGIIGRVTRAVLPIALKNSDSKLLREMTSGPAGKLINVFSPGFTQNFSRAFTYRGNSGKSLNSFEDVFHSFESIDSQWKFLSREGSGDPALNLLSLVTGSRDFKNLMMTGVKYWATEKANQRPTPVPIDPLYALASTFHETTVGQAISRDFPKVALLSVYNAKLPRKNGLPAGMRGNQRNNVRDARLISGSIGALLGF
jgi:hypothetical protein